MRECETVRKVAVSITVRKLGVEWSGLGQIWWCGQIFPLWDSVLSITAPTFTAFIGSVYLLPAAPPPLPSDDLGVPPWRPTWHAIQPRTSPHFTPDTKSWSEDFRSAQLHLWEVGLNYSFLWSRRPQLLSPVLSHFHLRYLSEISDSFWCLSLLQPQSFPGQNHYQFNKCHLLFFPPSIEHPQAKTPDGWILSSTNMLLPSWRKSDNGYNSAFTKGQSQLNNKYHRLSVLLQTLVSDCHSSQRPSQPLPHYCRHFNNSPQQRLLEREWEVGTFRKINMY